MSLASDSFIDTIAKERGKSYSAALLSLCSMKMEVASAAPFTRIALNGAMEAFAQIMAVLCEESGWSFEEMNKKSDELIEIIQREIK
jgi:hypothetical protein